MNSGTSDPMRSQRPDLRIAVHPDAAAGDAIERSPITVVLADDHTKVRKNIRRLLDAEADVNVVADVGDVNAAARHAHTHRPDVLVLDLHVPDISTVALVAQLRNEFPGTAILVLTMETSTAFARQVLAAGAMGYVLKERADSDLADAVRYAHHGQTFVSARVAARLEATERIVGEDGLTQRELDVLRLTALGYTAQEVARRLHVSSRTVETHRARVHEKLDLRTRADLVQYALSRGLLDLDRDLSGGGPSRIDAAEQRLGADRDHDVQHRSVDT